MSLFRMKNLVVLMEAFLVASCGGSDDRKELVTSEEPPTLPDSRSVSFDLTALGGNNFEFASRILSLNADYPILASFNADARSTIGKWNLTLNNHIILPIIALQKAQEVSASEKSDGIWQWEFDISFEGKSWKIEIQSEVDVSGTEWTMLGSKDSVDEAGCCEATMIMSGQSENPKKGFWNIYGRSKDNFGDKILAVTFRIRDEDDRTIIYANSSSGSSAVASVKEEQFSFTNIEVEGVLGRTLSWSKSLDGSITYNEDSEKGCWDEDLTDTSC